MAELINTNVFDSTKKFVDFSGLDYFWSKVKTYVDGVDTTLSQGVAANAANITQLQEDLGKLNSGEGSVATQINNAIAALNLPTTYETIANVAALKTELTQAIATAKGDAETAASQALAGHAADTDLHVTKAKQEAWDAAASAINAFLDENAVTDQVVNTLKEIQEYINTDGETSATLLADVAQNKKDIAKNAEDLASHAADTDLHVTAELQNKWNAAEQNAKDYAKQYTDELYSSIQFVTNNDIDGIFNKVQS